MTNLLKILNTPLIEIYKRLFLAGDFSFITITERGENLKQKIALKELTAGKAKEILYGGAAGGAKSWTGATWLSFMCICFANTRWFAGRDALTELKGSTLPTFLKVLNAYDIKNFIYKDKDHYLLFDNGSRIDFIDLAYYPSDPLYENLGSFEYTGGWIEEAGQVNFGAFDVLKTRVGRHLNDKYNIRPIIFITCNPKKNWLYYDFYTPWKLGKLDALKVFIQAFVQDNPANEVEYIKQLESLTDKAKKERLLFGNWDYDSDPAALCDFDAIIDCFTNDHVQPGEKRLSSDLAMQGRDSFIIGFWNGLIVDIVLDKDLADGKMIELDIKNQMIKHEVPHSKTVVDSDGMGNYIESYLKGIKEFHAGSTAFDKKEFANLKTECAYKLAENINKRLIKIICSNEQKQKIIEELGVLKSADVDADESRKRIIKKDIMKRLIGRSPDYLDVLIMGMFFEVKPVKKLVWA